MNTATTRSSRDEAWVVTPLIVALYLTTIAVPRIIGTGGAVRQKLIVEALLFGAILGGLGVVTLVRGRLKFDRRYGGIVALFSLFLLLSTVALAVGFMRGYPYGDVLGDYFKFVVPVLTVLLIYAASESSAQLETAFSIAFRIALLLFVILLGLYVTGVLSLNDRPGFVYQLPLVILLGYWLFRRGDQVARWGFPFLVAATLPLVFYTQSLSLLLQTGLTAAFAVVYVRSEEVKSLLTSAGALAVAGLLGGILFLLVARTLSASTWEQYGYLGLKMAAFVGDYTLYERLIILGGSRVAEPFGVIDRIDGTLRVLLFGSGMGSTFTVSSPFEDAVWAGTDHFVHSGLWEAVLRTGILGGLTYLGILLTYLYVGWHVSHDSYLGALAAANASVVLLFTALTGKLLGPQFFSYALFAYALIRWAELRAP